MPGFRHPPGADIQRIRQDLRDRYHDGFPILKELLQNADDAGAAQAGHAATQCTFALCEDGLPGAHHALLRGPGLAVINDGSFTAEDANSLTSLGLSNKAGQSASAGKFGLGLKSVFHWAEAFCYFSPHRFGGGPDIQSPGHDLLNPWSSRDTKTGRHHEWDEEWKRTREADCQAFSSLVSAMRVSERWFGLWIPLRRQEHTKDGQGTVQPIENRFPPPVLDELLGEDWRRRLAETLPLLRRIHAVRFCQHAQDTWQAVAEMRVSDGARRMRFGTEPSPVTQGTNIELSGQIEEAGHSTSVNFRGTESFVALPALTQLRDHFAWPSQSTLGPDGADMQVKEKAEPHGAVIFTRQAAPSQPALRVHHAVFLPLGEPEEVGCAGLWRFNLYLHGFFFVDSGRRGIQPFDELPDGVTPENAKSESQVTQLWNRTLLHELVAPLVLPSLEAFVRQEQMQLGEIETLVCSLVKSERLEKLTNWMCCGQRFIHRLKKDGGEWALEAWAATGGKAPRWLKLPEPDFSEAELFELLPTLAHLCGETTVSFGGKPRLAVGVPEKPSDEELAGLFDAVAATAFQSAPHLTYLLKLLPDTGGADSRLLATLVRLANGLLNQRLPEGKELRDLWNQFFQRLPVESFIRLPCHSTKASPRIVRALTEATLPVAVLWEDYRNIDGKGSLDWESLLPLLQSLGELNLADEVAIRQRSTIVVRLLQACEALAPAWTDAIAKLPLFELSTPSGAGSAASFWDLQTASGKGLLFTGGKEWAADLAKAAPTLSPLLIAQDIAEILDLGAAACGAAACVALLRDMPRLAADFSSRRPLFTRVLATATQHEDDSWAALRCLLHGKISAWKQTATLFDETGAAPILLRLLEKSLLASEQPWRRIPAALVGQLQVNAQHRQHLKLVPASEANIEELISEVGPDKVDCAELTREDCDYILGRFNDLDVLHGLNIHDTVGNERVCARRHTYVNDEAFDGLPPAFNTVVTRLRDRAGYSRQFTTASGTTPLVDKLSWESVIQIALDQPEPAQWWSAILTGIGHLGNLRLELRDRVREISWLPQFNGPPVAPSVLLHVSGAEAELDRLPDNIRAGRIPLLRLAQSVREHDRFNTFKSAILPPPRDALETLASLLNSHPAWSTGLSGDWTVEQVGDWVHAVGDAPTQALPVAPLILALHAEPAVCDLLPGFLQRIGRRFSHETYAGVLKHLAAKHQSNDGDTRSKLESVTLDYLKAINAQGAAFAREVLAEDAVRLLSKSGGWESPGQLAFECNGVPNRACLSLAQADAIPSLRPPENALWAEPATRHAEGQPQSFDLLLQQTPHVLRRYFSRWRDEVSSECIGAFLATLGDDPGVLRLAKEFLGNRSMDGIRQDIDAHSPPQLGQPLRVQATQYRFVCVAHGSRMVRLISILGSRFSTELTGPIHTVFLGDGLEVNQGGGNWYRRTLHLAPIPVDQLTSDRLSEILLNSTTAILHDVYCHREIRLRPLWERLSRAAQLHIRIAQNRVIDAAQAFLRQVGTHQIPEVTAVLKEWNDADRQRAEAEEAGRGVPGEVHQRLTAAKSKLRGLLEHHQQTQNAILAAVRHKIGQDYGYKADSVPFEIWQNADDALVELATLGYDCNHSEKLGFVLKTDEVGVSFVHWGRLVNEFQGSNGHLFRDRGFDEDLEKMVVQSISDKRASEQQGQAVTGKFGLGFKSVFLVTDAPEVLSGSVDFTIRGGIYPARLPDQQRDELGASLNDLAPDHRRRGTLIRLPRQSNCATNSSEVLDLFQRLSPLLVVFSRRLKRLRLIRPIGADDTEIHWQPQPVVGLDEVQFGELAPLDDGSVRRALVLSRNLGNDRLQFLLGLDDDGFAPLPENVPVFWVTAPTRATPAYGFAVNGPFEPDVGRVQLALQSEKNRQLAGDLASVLAARLKLIEERSSTGWPALRVELKLATGASADDFWNSLWDLLGKRFAAKCHKEDKSPVAALARRILWESEGDGLQWFYRDCAALPTGVWDDYRVLTRLRDLRHVAAGALDRELVFRAVSGWQGFQQRVAVGAICSWSQVASVLERLGVSLREVETVHLATVVEWESREERRADADLAAHLGELITPEFMNGLEKGQAGEREESEHRRLVELLQDVSFQAADGSWHKASKLVVAAPQTGVEQDEPMRAAFAPRECQLNPAYAGTALQFFLASRPRLEAGVEQMAEWVLKASDQGTQVLALQYLLNGELKDKLADVLREQRDDGQWLWQLASLVWFESTFSTNERHQLLAYVLRLFDGELRGLTAPLPPHPPEAPPKPIWTVEQLWNWWEQRGKPMGDYTLEGEANWDLFDGGLIGSTEERREELKRLLLSVAKPDGNPEGNALWYRLFGYACLLSAGRQATELRDFWTERLSPNRFWERTSAGDFSEETKELFTQAVTAQFTDLNAGGEAAYFWRRVFYDVRKIRRMVCEHYFPATLMHLVVSGRGPQLPHFLRTGFLPGPDQSRWVGTFGQSAGSPLFFVIRELVRLEVITDPAVRPLAYFVSTPVRRALRKIGWMDEDDKAVPKFEEFASLSEWLHKKIMEDQEFGPKLLPYFDIPLLHMGITHRGDKMPVPPQ